MNTRACLIGFSVMVWSLLNSCALLGGGDSIKRARGYSVAAPKSWIAISREDSDQAFRLPSGSVATLTTSCEVNNSASLDVLTRQLMIGARQISVIKREKIKLSDLDALFTSARTVIDGTSFHMQFVVAKREGCVIDFSLLNKKNIASQESDEFLTYARSFTMETRP